MKNVAIFRDSYIYDSQTSQQQQQVEETGNSYFYVTAGIPPLPEAFFV